MPDTNDGPAVAETDKPAEANSAANPLPGFADAMVMALPPSPGEAGEPKEATAVDAAAGQPEPKATEAAKAETPPAEAKEKQAPETAVNFDGFSQQQKATWERLHKAGFVTAEEVERARKESLFQSAWTKNNMKLAEERKAFQATAEKRKADLELLDRIRGDERLNAAWTRTMRGEAPEAGEPRDLSQEDVAAKFVQEQIALERAAREREAAERTAKEQKAYDEKYVAMQTAVKEVADILKIDKETAKGYLAVIGSTLTVDTDPVLHFTPEQLQERLVIQHGIATRDAEIAALKAQLGQRTQSAARTAKQSSPPAPRVAETRADTPMSRTEKALGIAPDWSNVMGFGFRDGQPR